MANPQDSGNLRHASEFAARANKDRIDAAKSVGNSLASAPAQVFAAQRHQAQMQQQSVESQLKLAGMRVKQQQYAQDMANFEKELGIRGQRAQVMAAELALKQQRLEHEKKNPRGRDYSSRVRNPWEAREDPSTGEVFMFRPDKNGIPRRENLPQDRATDWREKRDEKEGFERKYKQSQMDRYSEGEETDRLRIEKQYKRAELDRQTKIWASLMKAKTDSAEGLTSEQQKMLDRAEVYMQKGSQDSASESNSGEIDDLLEIRAKGKLTRAQQARLMKLMRADK